MKKKYNKKLISLLVILILVALGVGVSIAYFTSVTQKAENVVTVGKVDITLTEPNWNPEKGKNIEPNLTIRKDPTITNTGENDAYVYMKIKIPKEEVILVLDNELLSDKKLTELFTYTINSGWEEISKDETDSKYNTYLYAYTRGPLAPNTSTTAIFDNVKFKNILEGQLDTTKTYIVDVKSYAIQSNSIKSEGTSTKEKMIYIYNNYLKGDNE